MDENFDSSARNQFNFMGVYKLVNLFDTKSRTLNIQIVANSKKQIILYIIVNQFISLSNHSNP